MELRETIARRSSVRSFLPDGVPSEVIEDLAQACCLAPSAGDIHPYRIVVVTDEGRRKALAAACLGQSFVAEAPVSLVFLVDLVTSGRRYGRRGTDLYCLLDVGAAVENFMLAAVDAGLGTCWVGAFDEKAVEELLGAPPNWRAVSVVALGRPSRKELRSPPPSPKDMLYSEVFNKRW